LNEVRIEEDHSFSNISNFILHEIKEMNKVALEITGFSRKIS